MLIAIEIFIFFLFLAEIAVVVMPSRPVSCYLKSTRCRPEWMASNREFTQKRGRLSRSAAAYSIKLTSYGAVTTTTGDNAD